MSLNTQLDRLQECNNEIGGFNRVWRLSPSGVISPEELPCLYVLWQPMTDPIPRASSGHYVVKRRFRLRILVQPGTLATIDSDDDGAIGLATLATLLDTVIDYYVAHPRLDTVAGNFINPLAGMSEDVSITDDGSTTKPAPDGTEYIGTDAILTLAERRTANRLS